MVGLAINNTPDQPYSSTHGSVEDEMIKRFAHSHPFYKADKATVYSQLVIATLRSQYAYKIAPFKRAKNGCGEINALKAQFAGAAH